MNLINKPNTKKFILIIGFLFLPIQNSFTKWGFYAHKKINEMAIYTLPDDLRSFFLKNSHAIISFAVLPDQRRYIMDSEAEKHYMDLDYYMEQAIFLNDSIPYSQKIHFFTKEQLASHGIAAWNLPIVYQSLVHAFIRKDSDEIIKRAAELGHYLADLHVPLHTTSNYDGQRTGQTGLHSFWETKIPEYFGDQIIDFTGKASYIPKVEDSTWKWIFHSYNLVNEVLKKEQFIRKTIPKGKLYAYEKRGNNLIRIESKIFIEKFHHSLDGMVEDQFNLSIKHLGDLWYTAWLEAGEPPLID